MSRYSVLHPSCEMPYFVSTKQQHTFSAHQLPDLSCVNTRYTCLCVMRYIPAVFQLRDLKVVVKQTVVSAPKNIVHWVPHFYHPRRTNPKCTLVYPLCPTVLAPNTHLCFVFIFTLTLNTLMLDCVWNVMAHVQKYDGTCAEMWWHTCRNVMAHTQKPDFVFRRNGQVHLNRQGCQSTTGSWGVRIKGSNAGYTMFWGSVKSTVYPLHSPVSPSLPLPCVTVCHHFSTGLYKLMIQISWVVMLSLCGQ